MNSSVLLISLACIGATLIWPVNRWVMRNGGRAGAYGFWLALGAALASGCAVLALRQPLARSAVWICGPITGAMFALGFCTIIMYCLKIGPTGPTVAMNNMGLVWPVVLGALWLSPHVFSGKMVAGLILVLLSLIAFAFVRQDARAAGQTPRIAARWAFWAFLGWAAAGAALTAQLAGSIHAPESPCGFTFAMHTTATLLLAPMLLRHGKSWFNRNEMRAGLFNGVVLAGIGVTTLMALRLVPAEVVFPFTVAAPVILVLFLGRLLYHERLDKAAWLASLLGIAGLIFLSLG